MPQTKKEAIGIILEKVKKKIPARKKKKNILAQYVSFLQFFLLLFINSKLVQCVALPRYKKNSTTTFVN